MARQRSEKFDNRGITCIDKKSVIPKIDQMFLCQRFYFGEIHHHAIRRIPFLFEDSSSKGYFKNIAVPVQMPALAPVIRNTMTSIKL